MNLPAIAAIAMVAFMVILVVVMSWCVTWLHHRLLDAEAALAEIRKAQSVTQ